MQICSKMVTWVGCKAFRRARWRIEASESDRTCSQISKPWSWTTKRSHTIPTWWPTMILKRTTLYHSSSQQAMLYQKRPQSNLFKLRRQAISSRHKKWLCLNLDWRIALVTPSMSQSRLARSQDPATCQEASHGLARDRALATRNEAVLVAKPTLREVRLIHHAQKEIEALIAGVTRMTWSIDWLSVKNLNMQTNDHSRIST